MPENGADMLLDAAALMIRSRRLQVEIIGDGPEMASLRQQVVEAQIGHGVTFSGWIDHREVAKRLARSEVFALPSIRDFGGGVFLVAVALGLAPVVVDTGGP